MPRRRAPCDAPPPRCARFPNGRIVMLHHHDAAIGESGAQLQMKRRLRPGGKWAHDGDGVDLFRRDTRQRETRGDGLLGKPRGASVRAGRESVAAQLGFFDGRRETPVAQDGGCRIAQYAADSQNDHFAFWPPCWAFSILAYASRSATVRLNTGWPGWESGSAQK